MHEKQMNETEICQSFITPAIERAGWDKLTQIRREYSFTDGQVLVRALVAVRGKQKRADYLLFFESNLPLAVAEAKDNKHSVGGGMQQGIDYAETLDMPFVFSANGDGFLFHDRTGLSTPVERFLKFDEVPSPEDLWSRYRAWKGFSDEAERVIRHPYYEDPTGIKEPRYYQRIAVQSLLRAGPSSHCSQSRLNLRSGGSPVRRPRRICRNSTCRLSRSKLAVS